MKITQNFRDGSIEALRHTYGVNFEDPAEQERQAQLLQRQLTSGKWLGRMLMLASGRNPARVEQEMRNTIEQTRAAVGPVVTNPETYTYSPETGRLELADRQPYDVAHQQPDQQFAPGAPASTVYHYEPRHAAEK